MSQQPEFAIQKIYLKDSSFESPSSPAIFLEEWKPNVDIDFNVSNDKMNDEHYEIRLAVTVSAKLKDKTVFIAEVKQAGIFLVKNIPENDLDGILKGVCPNILFPYVRQSVSQLVSDGGFPPLYLAPVNFEAMYVQQHMTGKNEN